MGVVLIGYRGSGKTCVGRIVADRIGWRLVDTDDMVRRDSGMPIAEIFQREGQAGFRSRECDAVRRAVAIPRCVISAGGGVVESAPNGPLLGAYGPVVWLTADAAVLWQRISADAGSSANRPDLAGGGLAEVRSVLARREPLYRALADVVIETDAMDIDAVAHRVEDLLRSPGGLAGTD